MKKLLTKMAAGMFLAALSFMQANAQTCSVPVVTSPNVTVCSGVTITISGTSTVSTPYSVYLCVYGTTTPIVTVNNVTTTSFSIPYTVPAGAPNQYIVGTTDTFCGQNFSNDNDDNIRYDIIDNTTPNAYTVTISGSYCATPLGYPIGLGGSKTGVAYKLYNNGVFVSSLAGHNNTTLSFGNQVAPGTYTILGVATVSGCSNVQNGSVTILTVPGIPTLSYTWCGTGGVNGSLTLYGSSTTTGSGLVYQWSNITQGLTGPLNSQIWSSAPAPNNGDIYYFSVSSTGTGCFSASTITSNVNTIPGMPTITYTWCGAGGLTQFASSTTTGVGYIWSDLTHTSVTGSNTNTYLLPAPFAGDVYKLIATNPQTGCTSTVTSTPVSHTIPGATLQTTGGATSGIACLPASGTVTSPIILKLSGGTANITAYINNNGTPYFTYTTTPGANTFTGAITISNTGANVFSGTVSDAYCSASISTPLLTITGVANPDAPTLLDLYAYHSDFDPADYYPYPSGTYNLFSLSHSFTIDGSSPNAGETGQWYYYVTAATLWAPITGATTPSYSATQSTANAGQYYLRHSNSSGCYTNSITLNLNICPTCRVGLEDDTQSDLNVVFPNPTSGELNINAPYDNYTLSITNILGSEVLSKQVNQSVTKVDLSALSRGSYVLKIISPQGIVTKQIEVAK